MSIFVSQQPINMVMVHGRASPPPFPNNPLIDSNFAARSTHNPSITFLPPNQQFFVQPSYVKPIQMVAQPPPYPVVNNENINLSNLQYPRPSYDPSSTKMSKAILQQHISTTSIIPEVPERSNSYDGREEKPQEKERERSIRVPRILQRSKNNSISSRPNRSSVSPNPTNNANNVSTISLNSIENNEDCSHSRSPSFSPMVAPKLQIREQTGKMNRTFSCLDGKKDSDAFLGKTSTTSNGTFSNRPSWANERRRYRDESQNVRKHSHDSGIDMYKVVKQRKEVQQQLEMIENRIKKLRLEDAEMKEKIQKTREKGDEIMKNKLRHKKELEVKDNLREIRKKRNDVVKAVNREVQRQRKSDITNALIKKLQEKKCAAAAVKTLVKSEKERFRVQKAEEDFLASVRRAEVMKCEDKIRSKHTTEDLSHRTTLTKTYNEKLEEEKDATQKMMQKMKDLEAVELRLIDQLKHTLDIHQTEYSRVEQLYRTPANDPSITH